MATAALVKKFLVATVFAVAMFLPSMVAEGVTAQPVVRDTEAIDNVTTGEAARARADVQIRRIKNLIVTRNTDDDADYERLEKLQKQLRGEN